ncbi:TPA: hypothetical protein EYP45_04210 [Candidatus Peregrinibacteria bacterium]|nr:hypothetical protein [Candidatus Peregrinibacteria bacterium]HIQ57464.1 hypothetical protein [Candidatus Gracilibacteria bacterium]
MRILKTFFIAMKLRIYQKLIILLFDTIALFLSFTLAYLARLGTFSHSKFLFEPYIYMASLMVCIWIILLIISGRYSLKEKSLFNESKIVFFSSLSASTLFPLLFYFKQDLFFSRGIIILLFIFSTLFLFSISVLYKKYTMFQASKNIGISRMLVIGAGKNAEKIITNLLKTQSIHKPVAILTPYGSKKKEISGVKIFGKLDSLERIFTSEKIQELFLCEAVEHSENLASFCQNKGVVLRTSLETIGINHSQIETETIGETTFLTLQQSPLFGWGQFLKRLFDIIISSFILFIHSPVLLFVYIFQKQNIKKVTFVNGTNTTFFSYTCSQKTKYINFLLLLISVLKKNISIVGPKLLTELDTKLSESRFILRPGIFSPETNIKTETLYIRHWNFFTDMTIIAKALFRKS